MHTPYVARLQNSVGCFRQSDFFLAKYVELLIQMSFGWRKPQLIVFRNLLILFLVIIYIAFFLWISAVQPKTILKLIDLVEVEQRSRTRHPKSNLDWIPIFTIFIWNYLNTWKQESKGIGILLRSGVRTWKFHSSHVKIDAVSTRALTIIPKSII